ncbi:hypothetical protein G7046_g2483 [Stylonectria norvegica]|nr:hypothetical protein G7046_g2483 [Stylonectria norvegica]
MVSKTVTDLCQETRNVTTALALHPGKSPGEVAGDLYGHHTGIANRTSDDDEEAVFQNASSSAFKCGSWGSKQPSTLFLKAFADSLKCLDKDPLVGTVSPSLMGSHGTIPLTIIAPLADIIRHCSNLIVRAEKEVFFITCEWSPSIAQRLINAALVELSYRAGERGQPVVVRIMYDKPGAAHAIAARQHVKPSTYAFDPIQLPSPEQIPNLNLHVISMHTMLLGTLHAKFCVVDRKAAAVMSNNMEDNDNMEMMTHVEGPIVDSLYDAALLTWNDYLQQPILSHQASIGSSDGCLGRNAQDNLQTGRPGSLNDVNTAIDETKPRLAVHEPSHPHFDRTISDEITRVQGAYLAKPNETSLQAANRQLNISAKTPVNATGPEIHDGDELVPYISTSTPHPVPIALVGRPPHGGLDSKDVSVPQNEAWLSLIRNAQHDIFIQTPDLNATPLICALAEALQRGVEVTYYVCFGYNDAGEIMPGQGGTNEQAAQSLISLVSSNGPARDLLHIYDYVGKDQDHPIHQSFKSRSCHIKLLIADSAVGIQGSGNQDTQSWFHSQEMNIMVDSQEICKTWREYIDRNQNTKIYGKVAKDGVWRDKEGKPGNGYKGNPGLVEGTIKGALGMIKKKRGK